MVRARTYLAPYIFHSMKGSHFQLIYLSPGRMRNPAVPHVHHLNSILLDGCNRQPRPVRSSRRLSRATSKHLKSTDLAEAPTVEWRRHECISCLWHCGNRFFVSSVPLWPPLQSRPRTSDGGDLWLRCHCQHQVPFLTLSLKSQSCDVAQRR